MFNKLSHNIILLSLASLLIIVLQQGEINRDGIMYLTQSQYIIEGNWDKAMSVYNWPFFSVLIAALHQLSGLSLQYSAHLINIILFIMASFFFIKNITLVSNNRTPVVFATLILLTSIPLMDDYLPMVLRDQGQWTGFMMGVYAYLRWIKTPSIAWALMWQLSFMFGALFRPECLMFNILLPFTHQIFVAKNDRLKVFTQSISIPLLGLLSLPILWVMFELDFNSIDLARLNEIVTRPTSFLNNMLQPLPIDTENYAIRVLIADYAMSFKYLFFTYVAAYKWFAGLGLLHVGLFAYAIKQRLIITPYLTALTIFFALSAIISVINLYTTFILASRYWVMNFWIVYLAASIGLGHLWDMLAHSKHPRKQWLHFALLAILGVYFLNVVIDRPEEHFEQQAGKWVKEQGLDLNNVYFNQDRLAFYAGALGHDKAPLKVATQHFQYQYLLIRYHRFTDIQEIDHYRAVEFFPSAEKPKVVVYKRISDKNTP